MTVDAYIAKFLLSLNTFLVSPMDLDGGMVVFADVKFFGSHATALAAWYKPLRVFSWKVARPVKSDVTLGDTVSLVSGALRNLLVLDVS